MFKKLFAGIMAFAMVIGGTASFGTELFESGESISVIVNAETMGDYTYKVLDDGTVSITKYTGTDETVEIPSVIDGKSVSCLGPFSFKSCKSIKNITIPDSVNFIDYFAFEQCTGLTEIVIPDSVTKMSDNVFNRCTSLETVTLSKNLTYIKDQTFQFCKNLKNVVIHENIDTICYGAFQNCSGLTEVTIPDNVTKIERVAFQNCTNLTSVTIPASVTDIGKNAFNRCSNLTVRCYEGSAAEQYAKDNNINYEIIKDSQLEGKVYYQKKLDNSAVRFIAEISIDDIQYADSVNIMIVANTEKFNLNVKNAYHSIVANGKTVKAQDGKCFILTPAIEINDIGDVISAEFSVNNLDGYISREITI
ncbi:MAG: leucine-rich repeat domain-containing protein [Ruminococcus sp.]|nr:leucine-rich repeat domain-containing protein [Ruminococcus sp.]